MRIFDRFFVPNVGKMEEDKYEKGLVKALEYEKDKTVRREAAFALGRIGSARAVEPLIQALKDEDMNAREKAVEALAKIGKSAVGLLIQTMESGDSELRWEAAGILGEIKDKDKKTVKFLVQALEKDEDSDVRREAVWALGETQDAGAVEPLIRALKDEDWEIRERAAWALGEMPGEIEDIKARELLTQIQKDDKDIDVREAAGEALRKIKAKLHQIAKIGYKSITLSKIR